MVVVLRLGLRNHRQHGQPGLFALLHPVGISTRRDIDGGKEKTKKPLSERTQQDRHCFRFSPITDLNLAPFP